MRDLVILGAGGFACEASFLVEEINHWEGLGKTQEYGKWNLLGYIDEDKAKWGSEMRGYPVLGGWDALERLDHSVYLICVVGDPASKKTMVERALRLGRDFANLVHPDVTLKGDVFLGKGVLINKGCILTVNIRIGDHVSINPGCGIGHDTVIKDHSTLMWHVNLSGAVEIGEGCMLGSKATVLQEVKIGSWSTVGAGAVVTEDLPEACTAVGIPAKVIS